MPMPASRKSSSGKASAKPLACSACRTVAPGPSTMFHSCTLRGTGEKTTLTRVTPPSAIDLLRPFHERIHQAAGDLVEYRPHQGTQRGILEAIVQFQFDLAGALVAPATQRDEFPLPVQLRERPFDELHGDLSAWHMLVSGPEGLVDAAERDADLGLHAVFVLRQDRGPVAPGQKF